MFLEQKIQNRQVLSRKTGYLFRILNKIMNNQRICRLLKYQNENPFDENLSDVDGLDLIHKQICIIPKIPEPDGDERSFLTIFFDKYIVNTQNPDFKLSTIRFDIICPFNEWIVNDSNLRPYLIM